MKSGEMQTLLVGSFWFKRNCSSLWC